MSHPYIVVSGRDWINILNVIKTTIAYLALEDLREGDDPSSVDKLVGQYVNQIEENRDAIFAVTAREITAYIHFYNVSPSEGIYDEFKSIYFTSMAVSSHLVRLGLADLNKLHLRATLKMLDYRLEVPHNVGRSALTQRMISVINNNSLEAHFGKYGWYLIYKCLYNASNGKSKTL